MRKEIKTRLKEENRKRSEILKQWFSSFFMSLGVVVIAVTLIPKSPSAEIIDTKVFSDAFTYQVSVTDEDLAIRDGTLKIILENQMEYQEQSLTTGTNVGIFETLEADTPYTIRVMADKGFGLEVLAKREIRTSPAPGAAIISNTLVEGIEPWMRSYQVEVYVSNPEGNVGDVWLDISYTYLSWYEEQTYSLTSIPCPDNRNLLTVDNIPSGYVRVDYTVRGMLDGVETILDSYSFHTPFEIYGSLYVSRVTSSTVGMFAYVESAPVEDLTYRIELYQGSRLVQTKFIEPMSMEGEMHEEQSETIFENLLRKTAYLAKLYATYLDPDTLAPVEVLLETVEIETIGFATYTATATEETDHFRIDVLGNDPEGIYTHVNYYVYEITPEGFEIFQTFGMIELVIVDGEVSAQFPITKPAFENYKIVIEVVRSGDSIIRLELLEIEP